MSLVLYQHPFASYCQKVLVALYELDLPFTTHLVDDPGAYPSRWNQVTIPGSGRGAPSSIATERGRSATVRCVSKTPRTVMPQSSIDDTGLESQAFPVSRRRLEVERRPSAASTG